jgi:signal transduction histidine kinase
MTQRYASPGLAARTLHRLRAVPADGRTGQLPGLPHAVRARRTARTRHLLPAGSAETRARAADLGSVAAILAIGVLHSLPAADTTPIALITGLAGASTIAFVWFVRLVEELRRTQQELARTVVERERLRFAQDLHDLLGHTLSLIVVKAEVVRRLAPANPDRAAVDTPHPATGCADSPSGSGRPEARCTSVRRPAAGSS